MEKNFYVILIGPAVLLKLTALKEHEKSLDRSYTACIKTFGPVFPSVFVRISAKNCFIEMFSIS